MRAERGSGAREDGGGKMNSDEGMGDGGRGTGVWGAEGGMG